MRFLGVFNDFHTPNPGGVQLSGALAWDAIRAQNSGFQAKALLAALEQPTTNIADAQVQRGTGRVGMAAAALRLRGDYDVALFWHLDLLKLAPLLRLGHECRRVLFLHGTEAWRRREGLTRRLLGRVDLVLANTAFTLQRARLINPELRGRGYVLHLGVGVALAGPTPEPDPVPAAVMISRLHAEERYKGHDEVIAAWPLVLKRIPDAQLWIVGEGSLQPALATAAEHHGVANQVRFFGRCSESEKEALLRRARCLLLPSSGEGFGLVYLEAMRLGRTCLVGTDGGREVVNPPEAGFSVTHRTPEEIADAVVRLLTLNEQWATRSAAARARYEREYTAAHFGERLVRALQEGRR